MSETIIAGVDFGPLACLIGKWKGDKGLDIAPEPDGSEEQNPFYEEIFFEAVGDVENADTQKLAVVRYHQKVFKKKNDKQFHDQVGYWLWDAANKQVIKSFVVPRGYTVMAGGTAEADAKSFEMMAELGSETYGICSNQWLANEFKTVRFELRIDLHDDDTWSYEEDTVLQIKGQDELFHHRDKNTLKRVDG